MGDKPEIGFDFKDSRKKRVIFLSHCILNENVRYPGGAFRGACISEIIDQCVKNDIGIVQMPCPEQKAWGGVIKQWLISALGDRRLLMKPFRLIFFPLFLFYTKYVYRRLALNVANEIEDYVKSGFDVIGIVGIDGSPSCGVNQTLDIYEVLPLLAQFTKDAFDQEKMNAMIRSCQAQGRGLFINVLKNTLDKRKTKVHLLAHDLISEMDSQQSSLKLNIQNNFKK